MNRNIDTLMAKRKDVFECKKDYHDYLTRPNGVTLSEKDCLFLDLCIQWTQGGKITTSTYKWLLENKFSKQKHYRTVSRAFDNISLYIKGDFKKLHIINGKEYKDKIRIERVSDFDQKINAAIELSDNKKGQKCQGYLTKMSRLPDKNVKVSTYIRKKTPKENNINKTDLLDNNTTNAHIVKQETQLNKKLICSLDNTDPIGNIEYDEAYDGLARRSFFEKAVLPPEADVSCESNVIDNKKNDNYYVTLLIDFKYSESMLKEIISQCNPNRQHYTVNNVIAILLNIIKKSPDKQVFGGIYGFKKYMIAVINGQNDYTDKGAEKKEDRLISIAERQNQKQKQKELEQAFTQNQIEWN